MTFKQAFPQADVPPIRACPACYPQRPMVIKTVECTLFGKSRKIVFECPACGAIEPIDPTHRDPNGSPMEAAR
jgi:uncharacterized Zn finger protein